MKAILVIDFPDDYGDVNDNKAIVTLRNGKLGTSLGIYNIPLKPLPEAIPMSNEYEDYFDPWEDTYRRGWNDCLEEIEE